MKILNKFCVDCSCVRCVRCVTITTMSFLSLFQFNFNQRQHAASVSLEDLFPRDALHMLRFRGRGARFSYRPSALDAFDSICVFFFLFRGGRVQTL